MANEKNLFAGPRGKHVAPAGTVIGHSHSPARDLEHAQSQERGLARVLAAILKHMGRFPCIRRAIG
jgi:hypothetical protein